MREFQMAICDDEDFWIEDICGHLKSYMSEEDVELHVSKYHSGMEILDDMRERGKSFDIIFLDVEMPMYAEFHAFNGVDTACEIRKFDKEASICFVTSHRNYAFDAFQVNASGYLEKPVSYVLLREMLNKCVREIRYIKDRKMAEDTYIQISYARENVVIPVKKVIYIEKQRNKCLFHTTEGEMVCYDTLSNIYEKLNPNVFFYVHQGYIVNFNHIWEVKQKVIVVTGALEVPLSRKYHNEMRDRHMDKIYRLSAEMERERMGITEEEIESKGRMLCKNI